MKKLFLIITLSISTFIVGCGCGNSEPTNTIVPETETQAIELETETELATEEIIETETVVETTEAELDATLSESSGVEIVEVLDTKMYAIKIANVRSGDGTNYSVIGTTEMYGHLTVTGKTSNNWYEVKWGDEKGYLPAECLTSETPDAIKNAEEVESPISEEEWDAAMDILYPDDDTSTDVPEYGEGAHDNPDHEHDLSKHNW